MSLDSQEREVSSHRVEIEFDGGGVGAKLICPETGCSPAQVCSQCGRDLHQDSTEQRGEGIERCYDCKDADSWKDECWIKSWFDNVGAEELLAGKVAVEIDAEWDLDHMVARITSPALAAREDALVELREGMAELGFIVGRNPDGEDDTVAATLLVVRELLAAREGPQDDRMSWVLDEIGCGQIAVWPEKSPEGQASLKSGRRTVVVVPRGREDTERPDDYDELTELVEMPRDLLNALKDPSIIVAQDQTVFELIAKWQKARPATESNVRDTEHER